MHVTPILLSLAIIALLPLEAVAETPLISTMNGMPVARHGIASQRISDRGTSTLRAADDFVVPSTGGGWTVTAVEVNGMYLNRPDAPVPPRAVQVYVYDDNAGTPNGIAADAARYVAEAPSFIDVDSGDFHITLPGGGVFLPPGRYWLSVVVAMPVASGGQWVWTEAASAVDSGRANGHESVWTQSSDLTPYGCVGHWDARCGVCGVVGDPMDDTPDPDLAFAVYGSEGNRATGWMAGPTLNPAADAPVRATLESASRPDALTRLGLKPVKAGAVREDRPDLEFAGHEAGTSMVSLSDLLRVIALYNADGYECAPVAEAPCAPSPFDRTPSDWRISLSELLRVLQFYQAGGYRVCAGTEDGYCPVFD